MRRAMLAAFGVTALALTAPGAALAHHHGHHHKIDHKIKSKAHHARVRFEHFGASASATAGAGAGTTTTAPMAPTTAPTTPTSTGEEAGTVLSYEKEVLTIKLKDESTVTGKVTNDTNIECMNTSSTSSTSSSDLGSGDDKGSGDDENHEGDDDQSSDQSWDDQSSDQSDSSDDDVTISATPEPPCDSSALKPGTVVHAAELRVSSTGAEFESIELVR